jgi:3-oxoacyl-[acyl-carrier protein] reductase
MSGRLAGKVALIVGAARGIGAGIAERFHEEAARLVIADTEAAAGAATAERLEGKFIATDIAKPADAERAIKTALAAYGDLHMVVQNAGIYPWSLIEDTSPEESTPCSASTCGARSLSPAPHCRT